MKDEDRKRLTKFLGMCWHEDIVEVHPVPDVKGYVCPICGCFSNKKDFNRTFTTEADMMALYKRLHEAGKWGEFINHAHSEFIRDNPNCQSIHGFVAWLFCLSGEGYGERCQMVADLIREGKIKVRPKIVCLCGSTRFKDAFDEANYRETMAGKIVLSVGFFMHASGNKHGEEIGATPAQKVALDELHKRKIDLADEVLILDVGGYVGESTRSELEYARSHGKIIRYLEAADE